MKKRPPLYWRSIRIGGPAVVISATLLFIGGLGWLAVALVLLGAGALVLPWLLSPYSEAARRLAAPTEADLDRSERLADRLGAAPVFGVVWRFAERLSGNEGRRSVEEYRSWRREHEDE
jgi:hypothetical protein